MAVMDWLLVLLTAWGVPAVLLMLPLFRETIGKYLGSLVEHRLQSQLEALKSEFRNAEEKFKSELRAKEQQINTLVSTTLAMRSTRQSALDGRRLQAVEMLWRAKTKLDLAKTASIIVGGLNYKVAAQRVSTDEKLRLAFDQMYRVGQYDDVLNTHAAIDAERPFLEAPVWANFAAYRVIILLGIARLKFLARGINEEGLFDESNIVEVLRLALPDGTDLSISALHKLLDPLEQKLLASVGDMLDGKRADEDTLKRSIRIAQLANVVQSEERVETELPPEVRTTVRSSKK
jgi:hypothetical protein